VDIYESRKFIGGKVGSFQDKAGNHIEMGLHVFFGCYNNLFRLLTKVGAADNLLVKDHIHTFINAGGDVGGQPQNPLNCYVLKPYLSFFQVATRIFESRETEEY
jgi:uncharacterized protein with NAD-binding domain and iron-sulfur cluster